MPCLFILLGATAWEFPSLVSTSLLLRAISHLYYCIESKNEPLVTIQRKVNGEQTRGYSIYFCFSGYALVGVLVFLVLFMPIHVCMDGLAVEKVGANGSEEVVRRVSWYWILSG
jgi:hypothetical protein